MPSHDEHLRLARSRWERRDAERRLGVPPGPGEIDLASNDYLGLTRHPAVLAAAHEALHQHGTGAAGSRLVSGNLGLHHALDSALAGLLRTPAALVTSSGYLANLAVLTALTPSDALVVLDEHVHASLVDGARLARVPIAWAEHSDPDHVDLLLRRHGRPGAVVVAESVYSAVGDAAPLRELAEVTARHGALLVVDEAHGIGTVGPDGAGGTVAAGLHAASHVVVTGTLGKSLAAQGGFVAAGTEVVRHLVNTARPVIYDTALAPASAAAALAALDVLRREPGLVTRLRSHAAELAAVCGGGPPAAGVVSVPLPAGTARDVVAECARHGVRLGVFRPGSTPDGTFRLRLTAHADHGQEARQRAQAVLRQALGEQAWAGSYTGRAARDPARTPSGGDHDRRDP